MRKTHEQVKAELLRRREEYFVQQKKRRKAAVSLAATGAVAVILAVVCLPHIPTANEAPPAEDNYHGSEEMPPEGRPWWDWLLGGRPATKTKGESGETTATPQEAATTSTAATHASEQTQLDAAEPTADGEVPVSTNVQATTTRLPNAIRPSMVTHPSSPGATGNTTTAATGNTTTAIATLAPHGSATPYRGALADFTPVSVRLPYEGNTVQMLTVNAIELWESGIAITDRARKTDIGDETIGARYAVFRNADGYELTCLYCDTCIALGNYWYDITPEEAAAMDALLDAMAKEGSV